MDGRILFTLTFRCVRKFAKSDC